MPTTPFQTYSMTRLDPVYDSVVQSSEINVNLQASTTFPKGQVLAELTATPGTYGPYVSSAGVGGLGVPKLLLRYGCTTDASGNITSTGELGVTDKTIDAFKRGEFRIEELVGLDANAVTVLGGHVYAGAVGGTGIFSF